jgi:hypothetical protein
MEAADVMLGVTKTNDVSNIVPVRLEEVVWDIYFIYSNFSNVFQLLLL